MFSFLFRKARLGSSTYWLFLPWIVFSGGSPVACVPGQPAGHRRALPQSLGCSSASLRQTAPKLSPNSCPHRTILGICPPLPIHFTVHLYCLYLLQNLTEENEFFMALHGPRLLTDFLVSQTLSQAPHFLGQPRGGDKVAGVWGPCWFGVPRQGGLHQPSVSFSVWCWGLILWWKSEGYVCDTHVYPRPMWICLLVVRRYWLAMGWESRATPPRHSWNLEHSSRTSDSSVPLQHGT